MNTSHILSKVSRLSLLGLVAIVIILIVLHKLGLINAWAFPLKPVAAVLVAVSFVSWLMALLTGKFRPRYPSTLQPLPKVRQRNPFFKGLLLLTFGLILVVNVPTYLLAYHMTHVREPGQYFLGNPRPQSNATPADRGLAYTTHKIPVTESTWLEAWLVPSQSGVSKGTVILFPGNLGTKGSQLITPAQSFTSLGYDALLVDFQGVGGSSGNTTTVGIRESKDVVTAFNYAQSLGLQPPFIFYGVSMGSAAIMRAISVYGIEPNGVILELPFARFLGAIKSRLNYQGIPSFPTAEMLVFWGGVQHGVNGFGHNPIDFAKAINCPALVIHGEQDKWVTVPEVEALFQNLKGPKKLVLSPKAGHQQLIGIDHPLWDAALQDFFTLVP